MKKGRGKDRQKRKKEQVLGVKMLMTDTKMPAKEKGVLSFVKTKQMNKLI